MADTLSEYLRSDMKCEGLLECFHGLKQLDKSCYQVMIDSGETLTIDEIAAEVDRERSTVYRAIQRLLQTGLVQKEQINYDQGGYYHVYYPTDPDTVTDEMQQMLNEWYAQMGQLIQEFENKYNDRIETPPEIEG